MNRFACTVSLVGEIADLEARAKKTDNYRNQINYEYWETLAQAEREERTVRARRRITEAEEANAKAELDKAIGLYDEAFAIWAEIFDDYPILTIDDSADDLYESIRRYMIAIDSQTLPEDFPLTTFAEMMGQTGSVNSQQYQEVREAQRAKAEQRRQELAEEERKREEAAAKAEAEEKEKADKAAAEKEKADKEAAEKEKTEADQDAAEQASPAAADESPRRTLKRPSPTTTSIRHSQPTPTNRPQPPNQPPAATSKPATPRW